MQGVLGCVTCLGHQPLLLPTLSAGNSYVSVGVFASCLGVLSFSIMSMNENGR